MDTLAFKLLSFLFSMLYVISMLIWSRFNDKSSHRMKLVFIVLSALAFVVAGAVWINAPEVLYRTIFLCVVSIPLIMFTIRTFKLGRIYNILNLLIYLTFVPMMILYLK